MDGGGGEGGDVVGPEFVGRPGQAVGLAQGGEGLRAGALLQGVGDPAAGLLGEAPGRAEPGDRLRDRDPAFDQGVVEVDEDELGHAADPTAGTRRAGGRHGVSTVLPQPPVNVTPRRPHDRGVWAAIRSVSFRLCR